MFAPSILTILGIIFYLRTGYVVGEVGLGDALVIITLCYAISLLTSLSLAAVATSMRVKGGGFYYVISRTLGFEFGGALGLVLFLSISIGIAFYAIGLGEVVVDLAFLPESVSARGVAVVVIVLLFGFAWAGADVATKLQYVVMVLVFGSIIAIGWGGWQRFDQAQLSANMGGWFTAEGDTLGFWSAFALFFPAITGFTQGLNMSGDLRQPTRDIPLGTLAAVAVSYVLYVGVAILMAGTATGDRLREDYLVLETIAPFAWIVTIGVIAATASSAMASFLGAPRIAQALGQDDVFPLTPFLAKGVGAENNPRRAVLLSGVIALLAVAFGDLNFLAPIITMFFLASYALLNYATYVVARSNSPSFRPTFTAFHQYLSLAGGLACVAAMLAINFTASLVAVVSMILIHVYLRRRSVSADWSDSQRAYRFQRVREELFALTEHPPHPRDWRPQILVLSKHAGRRRDLLKFSAWIEASSGLTTLVSIVEEDRSDDRSSAELQHELDAWIHDTGVQAFARVIEAPDFRTGLSISLQAYGVGPLQASVVLLNWLDRAPSDDANGGGHRALGIYGHNLAVALAQSKHVVVLNSGNATLVDLADSAKRRSRIDIWWSGGATGELMLLLAHLMTRTREWQDATLRVLAQGRDQRPERTVGRLNDMLDAVRIVAEVKTIDQIDEDVVARVSGDATLTYFPCLIEDDEFRAGFGLDIERLVASLTAVALCIGGDRLELAADPDEFGGQDPDAPRGAS